MDIKDLILCFTLAFAISLAATPFVITLAHKIGAVDVPDSERRVHKKPIPRLGGLAIFYGFLIALLFFAKLDQQLRGILIGALIIVGVGIIDDVKQLKATVKLGAQIVAAVVVVLNDVRISAISVPTFMLKKTLRADIDLSDKTPGWKFAEYEMKGIPVRLEIGPKDIENNSCVLVRRDTGEKISASLDGIEETIAKLLEDIQNNLFNKALEHRNEHTYTATDYDSFKEIVETKPGFVKSMWCGDEACENKIKEDTGATARCMPFEQENLGETCVCCGKKAKTMVYWGRAY